MAEREQREPRERRGRRGRAIAVTVTAGVLLVSAGTAVGLTLAPTGAPRSVDPPSGPVTVTAATAMFDDARPVGLAVVPSGQSALTSPASGRVTSSDCRPGAAVVPGSSPFSVDDQPLIALATSRPIWRDLGVGDTGPDVRALQEELKRLGQATAVDGSVGAQTLRAARAVAAAAGRDTRGWETVPAAAILWLPANPATVSACRARPGDLVDAGDQLATLPAVIEAARVNPGDAPSGANDGAREAVVDGEVFPLDGEGSIAQDDLPRLAGTPSYRSAVQQDATDAASSAEGRTVTVAAQSRLAAPVPAWQVPPAALYDIRGTAACVLSDGRPRPVTILGSKLGAAYVSTAAGATLRSLRLQPEDAPECG